MVFDGTTVAVMMASPQEIRELAYGFALTEGIITTPEQVSSFEIAEHETGIEGRIMKVCLRMRLPII